jgi:hypothetical protein
MAYSKTKLKMVINHLLVSDHSEWSCSATDVAAINHSSLQIYGSDVFGNLILESSIEICNS